MLSKVPRPKKPPPLAEGETWFVRLPKGTSLLTVIIDELTELTVVLRVEKDGIVGYGGHLGRYIRAEVEFVERVPE